MKLHFSITTFKNKDLAIFFDDPYCKFFIFQYEFNTETPNKQDLLLKCYAADKDLMLLMNGTAATGINIWTNPEVKTKKGFVIGNITVEKTRLKDFFPAAPDSPVKVTPVPKPDAHDPTYIAMEIKNDSASLALVSVNPSPPARRP